MQLKSTLFVAAFLFLSLSTGKTSAQSAVEFTWQNPLPTGNSLNDVAFFSRDVGIAIGDAGDILRTTDAGESWSLLDSVTGEKLIDITVVNGDIAWIIAGSKIRLYTDDGGVSWRTVNDSLEKPIVYMHFFDAMHGLAINSDEYVFYTEDGGMTWPITDSGHFPRDFCYYILDDTTWFCGGSGAQIYRTTDAGHSWQGVHSISNYEGISDFVFISRTQGYAAGPRGKIFYTADRGLTWEPIDVSYGNFKSIAFIDQLNGVAVGENGLIARSTDGGLTWQMLSSDLSMGRNLVSIETVDGHAHAVGPNAVIISSLDGGASWKLATPGSRTNLNTVAFFDDQYGIAAGEESGSEVLRTTDGGMHWNVIESMTGYFNDIVTLGDRAWMVRADGVIMHSHDKGENWETQWQGAVSDLHSISFSDSLHGIAVGEQVVARTTDGGNFWEILPRIVPPNQNGQGYVQTAMSAPSIAWVIGGDGNLYQTTNGGGTWNVREVVEGGIGSLFFLDAAKGWLTVSSGSNRRIYHTADSGATWSEQLLQVTVSAFRSISFSDPDNGAALILGMLCTTADGGRTWERKYLPLRTSSWTDVHCEGTTCWVAGSGGKIVLATRSSSSVHMPGHSSFPSPLYVYPNPATRELFIEPQEAISNGELTLTDMLGRAVMHVSELSGEKIHIDLGPGFLASGQYIATLRDRSREYVVKLTVVE